MTVGCATCHDHKFDPISQKDFYALGAFFRNTTQKVMDGNIPNTPPIVVVPRADDRHSWDRVTSRLEAIRVEMEETARTADVPFHQWLERRDRSSRRVRSARKTNSTHWTCALSRAPTRRWRAVRFSDSGSACSPFQEERGCSDREGPPTRGGEALLDQRQLPFPTAEQKYVIAAHQNPNDKNRGWVLDVGARVIGMRLVGDGGRSIETRAGHFEQLKPGEWYSVAATYDGSRKESGINLYLNGRAISTQGMGSPSWGARSAWISPWFWAPRSRTAPSRIFAFSIARSARAKPGCWPSGRRSKARCPCRLRS